jgi:putative ubiquitin-RnfH superfamily antitoxin RatB of RatAB toxin-antitoxin module
MPEDADVHTGDTGAEVGVEVGVEVVYAEADRQVSRMVRVRPAGTVAEAIAAANLQSDFPGLEIDPERVGIFGRMVAMDQVLRDGDRVEIYRPLKLGPMEQRRLRAERQKRRQSSSG